MSFEELFARKLSSDKGHQASISSSRRANDYHGGIFYVLLCKILAYLPRGFYTSFIIIILILFEYMLYISFTVYIITC